MFLWHSLSFLRVAGHSGHSGHSGHGGRSRAKNGFTDFAAKGHATVVLDCCHSSLPGLGVREDVVKMYIDYI